MGRRWCSLGPGRRYGSSLSALCPSPGINDLHRGSPDSGWRRATRMRTYGSIQPPSVALPSPPAIMVRARWSRQQWPAVSVLQCRRRRWQQPPLDATSREMVPFNVVVLRSKNIEEWKRMVDPKSLLPMKGKGGGAWGSNGRLWATWICLRVQRARCAPSSMSIKFWLFSMNLKIFICNEVILRWKSWYKHN